MTNLKEIHCRSCHGLIETNADLVVTTTLLFAVIPYHHECFSDHLKGIESFFIGNQPINGLAGGVITILLAILGLFLLVVFPAPWKWVFLILISPVFIIRLYSYLAYERHLPMV